MKTGFSISDTIAGYVASSDPKSRKFKLKTSDDREFEVLITDATYAYMVMNFGDDWKDCMGDIADRLVAGAFIFVHGFFYPDADGEFEAKWLVFNGDNPGGYRHMEQDWWIRQISAIASKYIEWQFDYPEKDIDYNNYRTKLHVNGQKLGDGIQEVDTISRMTYGMASAYMLTGDEKFLEAAEKGTNYLRDHARCTDKEDIVYWLHAVEKKEDGSEEKMLCSLFGDDYGTIPVYEQIYALAGPIQTYRLTGDPQILDDADKTIALFDNYCKDKEKGGYWSHIDPETFSCTAEKLDETNNRARKNWNSVGDHAPAYLINLWLATGDDKYADFLEYTFDTIEKHFPDYDESPFVQEKFFDDWSKDQTWGWQQNRAVVGHNLKIAWNLMRMNSLRAKDSYVALARKIADLMPDAGCDRQRGGCYDVVSRTLEKGQKQYRFTWHDRKAWWQQEQMILAYLILYGILGDDEYGKHAVESAAFYNAFFLDLADGGVYFNVLANGLPYLCGTERHKGSHSMSAYHSTELCFLAAVYTNLLITKKPMDFYFAPKSNGFKDGILRVSPDILPAGSIKITSVEIDGNAYDDYDAEGLTVKLPETESNLRVKVTVSPV